MPELTRIKNNQIYNSTIIAYQKVVPGSITGNLLSSSFVATSDLTITGNLTVLGVSTYTNVASTNTFVNDPIVLLNNGITGTNTNDIGFVFNRGSSGNVAMIWNETRQLFELKATADTGYGSPTSPIDTTTFSNIQLNSIFGNLINANNNITITNGNLSIQATNPAAAGTLAGGLDVVGNAAFNGGFITTNQATFALLNTTAQTVNAFGAASALNIGSTSGIANIRQATINFPTAQNIVTDQTALNLFNANVATLNAFRVVNSGNLFAGTGTVQFNSPTIVGLITSQNLYNTVTTNMNFAGAATALNIGATTGIANIQNAFINFPNMSNVLTNSAHIDLFNANVTQMNFAGAANALNIGSGAGYANVRFSVLNLPNTTDLLGTQTSMNVFNANTTTMNFAGAAIALNMGAASGIANIQNAFINFPNMSNVLTNSAHIDVFNANVRQMNFAGAATALNMGFAGTGIANIRTSTINFPGLTDVVTNSTQNTINLLNANVTLMNFAGASTLTTIGAATGIANVRSPAIYFPNASNIYVGTNSVDVAMTPATVNAFQSATALVLSATTGNTFVRNSLGVNGVLWANLNTATTTLGTGAVVIPFGGLSVGGAANIGSTLTGMGATTINNTLTVGGITTFNNITNSAQSASTGAVRILGGASISQDLWVGGNIYVSNLFSTSYQLISVQDPLLYLTAANTFPYNYSIGIYSQFQGPDANTGVGNVYQHTGVVRDHLDNTWKFFSNARPEPGATVTFDNSIVFDPMRAGNLTLVYAQDPTSTTTGNAALRTLNGGAVFGGNIFQSGAYLDTSVTGEAVVFRTPATGNLFASATSVQIGAIASATLTTRPGTVVGVNATQALYNTVASIINLGGAANITMAHPNGTSTVQGNLSISQGRDATSSTAAALVVSGGLGINGNIFIGSKGNYIDTAAANLILAPTPTAVEFIKSATFANVGSSAAAATLNLGFPLVVGTASTQGLYTSGNTTTMNFANTATSVNIGGTTGIANIRNPFINFPNMSNVLTNSNHVDVFNANVAQMNFAGAATALNMGFAGTGIANIRTSTINFPGATDVVTNQVGTLNVFNANVTTVNEYGAATAINIGATGTGNVFIRNDIVFIRGTANVNSSRDALSTNTAALTVAGGAAVRLGMIVGGTIYANAAPDATALGTGALVLPTGGISSAGNIIIARGDQLLVGYSAGVATANVYSAVGPANFYRDISGASRIVHQNTSTTGNAWIATEYLAMSPNGTETTGYAAFGIAGNVFARTGYTLIGANDTYVLAGPATATPATNGNLVIGTVANRDIVFFTNGPAKANELARFNSGSANLAVVSTTISTSPTTGAFTVTGGVGISGNINIAGGAVINRNQTSDPVQVWGAGTANSLVYVDTVKNAAVFGGANTLVHPGAVVKFNSTDSIIVPAGTDAEQPDVVGNVAVAGMIRYSTTINQLTFYNPATSSWNGVGSSFTIIASDLFFGNNVQTTFTCNAAATTNGSIVTVNGIVQIPGISYSMSGTQLTFTEAPAIDDYIEVRRLTTTSSVDTISSGFSQYVVTGAYANITTGTVGAVDRISVNQQGGIGFVNGADQYYNQTALNIPSTNMVAIDTFAVGSYSSAEYTVQIKQGTAAPFANVMTMKASVVHNGVSNCQIQTYAVVSTGGTMAFLDANISAGNVNLWYLPNGVATVNSNVKVTTEYIV